MMTRPVREDRIARRLLEELLTGNITEVKPSMDLSLKLGFAYPQVEGLLSLSTS